MSLRRCHINRIRSTRIIRPRSSSFRGSLFLLCLFTPPTRLVLIFTRFTTGLSRGERRGWLNSVEVGKPLLMERVGALPHSVWWQCEIRKEMERNYRPAIFVVDVQWLEWCPFTPHAEQWLILEGPRGVARPLFKFLLTRLIRFLWRSQSLQQ